MIDDDRHKQDRFGSPIGLFSGPSGLSRWFKGEPNIEQTPRVPVHSRWLCPQDDCDGEMVANGATWPMNPPGNHHTCDKCGFTAAISGQSYPTIEYKEHPRHVTAQELAEAGKADPQRT